MSTPILIQVFVGFFMIALVFVPLERWIPLRTRQRHFRTGWHTDVIYYVVGCVAGYCSSAINLAAALLIRHATGLDFTGSVGAQPGWLQVVEIVVVYDFFTYVYHRFVHRNPWMWRLHRVHHSCEHMDWLANVRLHPIDKLLGDFFPFIPILCMGFTNGALLAYSIVLGCQGFLNHANIRLDYGPLRWIVTSPEYHHWHHADDPAIYDTNFALHLTLFDFLFGTLYLPPRFSMPDTYGLPDPLPEDFWGQLLSPFRREKSGAASNVDRVRVRHAPLELSPRA